MQLIKSWGIAILNFNAGCTVLENRTILSGVDASFLVNWSLSLCCTEF